MSSKHPSFGLMFSFWCSDSSALQTSRCTEELHQSGLIQRLRSELLGKRSRIRAFIKQIQSRIKHHLITQNEIRASPSPERPSLATRRFEIKDQRAAGAGDAQLAMNHDGDPQLLSAGFDSGLNEFLKGCGNRMILL